jgi:hypothetical protein
MGIVRCREFALVAAGLSWPAAALAPAAMSWMSRAARPSWPGRLARWGPWPPGWREPGSPVPGGLAPGPMKGGRGGCGSR